MASEVYVSKSQRSYENRELANVLGGGKSTNT